MTLATVRPLQAADERAVETLLHDLGQHDPTMLMGYCVHQPQPDTPVAHSVKPGREG